jgi:hypothetical protein
MAVEEQRERVNLPVPIDGCKWGRDAAQRLLQRDRQSVDSVDTYGYVCVAGFDPARVEADVRNFLWSHWVAKRAGVASFTVHSKEGDPTTLVMAVRLASEGVPILHVTMESLAFDRGSSSPRLATHTKRSYSASEIHRIEIPASGLEARRAIADSVVRSPSSYRLSIHESGSSKPMEF